MTGWLQETEGTQARYCNEVMYQAFCDYADTRLLAAAPLLPLLAAKSCQPTSQKSVQEDQIPALHVAAANPDPSAHLQQYQQDSLEVDASEWSQSRSARRKQKRKDQTMQSSPLDAGSTTKCTVQPTKQLVTATESSDIDQNIAAVKQTDSGSALAAVAVASGAQLLRAKQRSKRSGSKAASPLGKKKDAGNRGRGSNKICLQRGLDSQAGGQDVEAIQIALQEEAELQIMVRPQLTLLIIVRTACYQPVQITVTSVTSCITTGPYSCASNVDPSITLTTWPHVYTQCWILSFCVQASSAVSRARAANADFCQVERSHRSGSNAGLSPRRVLLVRSSAGRESASL